jgi:hypothetical protein
MDQSVERDKSLGEAPFRGERGETPGPERLAGKIVGVKPRSGAGGGKPMDQSV